MIDQLFLGKGEAHFYLAIQQVGRYKDQLAVFHVQQSLTVSMRIANIHYFPCILNRHFMMLYVYKLIMHVYGKNMVMHVCFFIR